MLQHACINCCNSIDSAHKYIVRIYVSKINLFVGALFVNLIVYPFEVTILKLTQAYLSNSILTFDTTSSIIGQFSLNNVHVLVSQWQENFTKVLHLPTKGGQPRIGTFVDGIKDTDRKPSQARKNVREFLIFALFTSVRIC